ncbi:NADH dehydrogenase-like protein YumB [Thermobacillus xylanilyticus]|jgi:NADH dehydrogenase|uniref:NADH dehydrogenase, FAD-containing subunit n=2 Tax=Thermobacillus TaxID=76632 RepID=L0EEZ1_THECK|nr:MULTISPECIES: NAD(P)/FAD-dependent oxidoreductase [Thermobacillus]AGA58833.1 NADH dehydrogenase, FAD-containing subunit [Thermobacillus composti KWC4]REJ17724.1 MAG: NAD(P)/FAD-dependent oxidoreductase [Paenibacillaceae bacterium]CAG5091781.1 NADH dehydrogenase-like protein YumB [Thermobacillus xylanilyticus]
MSSIPKIVILGAGYGGVMTALRLQKQLNYNEADVTLVNKHDYHYITTHLHMPAAGTDSPENARVSISKLIDEFKIDFVKSTVVQIRPQDRKVILEDGTLSYDYLVIGVGGEPETFGIPGLKEYALNIRSINSVRLIREHIEYQFAKYKREPHRTDYLTFIVGGAGFTGIEFVGELADRIPQLCREFDVDPQLVKLINIEAAPTALPGFDPELVEYAMDVLRKKGVTFRIGTPIKECKPDGVIVGEGEEIKAQTVIWTGGIRGNRLIEEAGFETMRGRVKVDEYLRAPGHDNVYVVGDNSLVFNEEGRPYPPTAQIAMQQGVAVAHNLVASIRNQALKKFEYKHKGTVASLGKGEAIGIAFGKKYKGWTAAQLKKLIDLRYLFIIGGIPLVLRKGKFF